MSGVSGEVPIVFHTFDSVPVNVRFGLPTIKCRNEKNTYSWSWEQKKKQFVKVDFQ